MHARLGLVCSTLLMHIFITGLAKTGLAGPLATSMYPQIQVSILDFVSQLSVADPGGEGKGGANAPPFWRAAFVCT